MVSINLRDNADEFRIEISGRFAGTVVDDVLYMWKTVLTENDSRRFTIDITHLTGYDYAGCSLLTDMQKYGTYIAAGSPRSLVFLNEISGPRTKFGPTLVRRKSPEPVRGIFPLIPVASGE